MCSDENRKAVQRFRTYEVSVGSSKKLLDPSCSAYFRVGVVGPTVRVGAPFLRELELSIQQTRLQVWQQVTYGVCSRDPFLFIEGFRAVLICLD